MTKLRYDQVVARFLCILEQQEGMRRDHGERFADNWGDKQFTALIDAVCLDDDDDEEEEKRYHFLDYIDRTEAARELKDWIESLSDEEHAWYFGVPVWQRLDDC